MWRPAWWEIILAALASWSAMAFPIALLLALQFPRQDHWSFHLPALSCFLTVPCLCRKLAELCFCCLLAANTIRHSPHLNVAVRSEGHRKRIPALSEELKLPSYSFHVQRHWKLLLSNTKYWLVKVTLAVVYSRRLNYLSLCQRPAEWDIGTVRADRRGRKVCEIGFFTTSGVTGL